jgi:hypothetical protein
MGIVYPGDAPERRNDITRQDRVQVDGANTIHLPEQQVKKETEIVFQVKKLSPLKEQAQPALMIDFPVNGDRIGGLTPYKGDRITRTGEGMADPYHTLIIAQIIGHRTKDPFSHPIDLILGQYSLFLSYFTRNFLSFKKIALISPTANSAEINLDEADNTSAGRRPIISRAPGWVIFR